LTQVVRSCDGVDENIGEKRIRTMRVNVEEAMSSDAQEQIIAASVIPSSSVNKGQSALKDQLLYTFSSLDLSNTTFTTLNKLKLRFSLWGNTNG